MANCPSKSSSSNQSLLSRKCSFCGAAKRCSIKNCKGYNMQCSKCKLFGHVGQCCSDYTKSKGRKTMKSDNRSNVVDKEGDVADSVNSICLKRVITDKPQQVKAIVWCNMRNRFTQQLSPNHTSLKLEIETLHSVDLDWTGNSVVITKEPITAPNKRFTTDTSNCPDTGATITVTGKHVMKKMGLKVINLHKDQTRCSTADGSPLKMLGFIPVKLRVKGKDGQTHETNKCLYFAEGVNAMMVSLRALKNLGCVPEHWPLPASHVYGLTEEDNKDKEEEKEEVIVTRQPTPNRPSQPPFPFTEENIPKLKEWLVKVFSASSSSFLTLVSSFLECLALSCTVIIVSDLLLNEHSLVGSTTSWYGQ